MTDPYKVLGVSQTSSLDEIKIAYKKLARIHHPDLNAGNKKSEEKFKEIAHAFALIGTFEARAKFDAGETNEQKQEQYDDYIKSKTKHRSPPHQGNEDFFSSFFRNGNEPHFRGADQIYSLEINFKESALGAQKTITLPNGKNLQVEIPAGITSGKKLRFKGQGGQGLGKGPYGDLYVQINVHPSDKFKQEGKDVISEVSVSIFEAINGGEVEIETIDGKILLSIPPGVSTGTKVRVKGKGIGTKGQRGSHLALIKVVMPKIPSTEFKNSMSLLEKKFQYNPRTCN